MSKPTSQKRELFAHTLKKVFLGVFAVLATLTLLATLTPSKTIAATNNTINFQAKLETAAGAIAPDGNYNIEFKLYNNATPNGTPDQGACTYNAGTADPNCLWVETRTGVNTVHVANGYITVNLGSVTAFPTTINWDQQLWLSMRVGGTGTPSWDAEMSPRLALTAVPYAFRAGQLAQYNGSTGFTSTLSITQPTGGNQSFVIPDQGAAGTYNLLTQSAANGNYIQAQALTPGTGQNTNFNLGTGTGIAATFNATTALQTAGTTRIDSSGNLTNIGSYSGSGNIYTSGGVLQVAGTGTSYIMGALGLGTTSPQAGSALTVTNGQWISSTDAAGTGYVNMFQVNSNNEIQVGAALNVDGGIVLPTDGGQLTFADLPISSTTAANTPESYTFRVGSGNVLTVYGQADGAGNLQNGRVAIGSSIAPAYTLDVGGDVNTTGNYRVGGTAVIASTGILQSTALSGTYSNALTFSNASNSFTGSGSGLTALNGTQITSGTVSVARGGTGAGTFTQYGILYGNGTSALTATAAGTTGQCLVGNNTAAPSWVSCTTASGGSTPGGTAGGDLSGTYPNPTVAKIANTALNISGTTSGQVLVWNGSGWTNTTVSGDVAISSTGVVTIANGAVTGAKIANSTITNTNLAAGSFGNITGVGTLGSLTVTGATNINTTGSATTTIGNNSSATTVNGLVAAGSSSTCGLSAVICVTPTYNVRGILIQATNLGQAADLQQLENSSGSITAGFDAGGQLFYNSGSYRVTLATATQANDVTLTIPADTHTTDTLCLATLSNCSAVGSAGGDLSGTYPNPQIAKLQGGTLTIATLAANQVLNYNGSAWVNTGSPTLSGNLTLQGALNLTTTSYTNFTTPLGTTVSTKINIPLYNPGAYNQEIALGLPSTAPSTSRVISIFDDRPAGNNQPALAVFSPDENNILGLGWDGQSSVGYLKTTGTDIGIESGTTTAAIFKNNGNVQVAGTIDTLTGTALNIGTTNASSINLNQNTQIAGNLSFLDGANRTIGVNTQTVANGNGNSLTVQSGTGNGTGNGGNLILQAAASGTGATGNGGALSIAGGNAASTNGNGGNITLTAGAKAGTGTPGSVLITPQAGNDSTTAFQVQNAGGFNVLGVDTQNLRVSVGANGTPTGQLYVGGALPSGPVGTYGTGDYWGAMDVQGNYAYVLTSNASGLNILDITNPASPTLVSSTLASVSTAHGIAVQGHYAYIVGTNNQYLTVVDISNPTSPTIVGGLGNGASPEYWRVVVQGRYAYLLGATANNTMRIVDVSNPADPVVVSTTTTGTAPNNITLSGNYAYVVNYATSGNVFQVFDITNPASPSNVGNIAAGTASSGLYNPDTLVLNGSYAYVSNGGTMGAYVVDLSNPASPTLVGSGIALAGAFNKTSVQGNRLYTRDYNANKSWVYDITSPTTPTYIGSFGLLGNPQSIYIAGRYLYTDGYTASTSFNVYDLGGAYLQQLQVGSVQASNLNTSSDASIGGSLSVQGGLAVSQGINVNGDSAINGSLILQNNTNSTAALQVRNAAGASILSVDTASTVNLVGNSDFEVGTAGWYGKGSASISQTTAHRWQGNASLSVVTTTATNDGVLNYYGFAPSTQYTLSFYAKVASGSITDFTVGHADVGGTPIDCLVSQTLTTAWTRFSCTFTTGATITNPNLYFVKTGSVAETFYIDAVQLELGASATTFNAGGAIQLNGFVDSQATFKNLTNSTTAFQVQNAASSSVFNVDTANGQVAIGSNATMTAKLSIIGTADQTQLLIKANSAQNVTNSPLILVQNSSAAELFSVRAPTTNSLSIGNAAGASSNGTYNTFVGYYAGNHSTGTENTAFGANALLTQVSGQFSTAIGTSSLQYATASNNTAVGDDSGLQLTSGTDNTLMGMAVSNFNQSGGFNTIIGSNAAYGVTGNSYTNNSILGYKAGYALTTGSSNVLFGYQAGNNLTSGGNNIIIGSGVTAPSATGSNQLNIGNTIYGNTSTGYVGIGTATAPSRSLDIGVNNSTVNAPAMRLLQGGSGDASIELNTASTGTSIYLGQDASNGGGFAISSSTAAGGNSAITNVQTIGTLNSINPINQTFSSPVSVGNTIIASVTWDTSNTTSATCSDTLGNTFTTALHVSDAANKQDLLVCYAPVTAGGTDTVSVTFGASAGYNRLIIGEYSGINTSSPVDVTAGAGGATATTSTDGVTSGVATTTQSNDLIYGAVMDTTTSTAISAGTGFTDRLDLNGTDTMVEDKIQSSAGSAAATFTFGTADKYDAIMVAFKAKSGSPTDTFSSPLLTLSQTGAAKFQNSTNSTAAFQVQNASGNGLLTADTTNGALNIGANVNSYGDNISFLALATPTITSVTPVGTAGTTTYGYRVSAINAQGETLASSEVTTTTGNATLSATNYNSITWSSVNGATSYKVYGRTAGAELYMATVTYTGAATYTYNDQGTITPSGALPAAPVGTGLMLQQWGGQSTPFITLQDATGAEVARITANTISSIKIGYHANAVGNTNNGTFLGKWAGNSTTALYATAIGNNALYSNTTGADATAVGDSALYSNTTGSENTAVGDDVGHMLTTGWYNSYFGQGAAYYNQTGGNNAVLGYEAGYGVSGNSYTNNTLIGTKSGYALTTGSNNVLLGNNAGNNLTSGGNNILIGAGITAGSATGSNQLNIGNVVQGDTSIGSALFKNVTNSTAAFQIQNAAGANLVNVNTLTTNDNLWPNPSFEQNINGAVSKGGSTLSPSQDVAAKFGNSFVEALTSGAANQGIAFSYPFKPSTTYSLSLWMRRDTSSSTNINIGRADNGTDTDCLTSQTINTTWAQVSCTFTTGTTIGPNANFYVKQDNGVTFYIYVDGVTLVTGSTPMSYVPPATTLQINPYYNSVTINAQNSGEIQPWQLNGNPLPGIRSNPGVTQANGYIYVIGGGTGTDGTTPQNTVYYAKVNADGSLGSWNTNANSLGTAVSGEGVTVVNGYIYALGGYTGSSINTVQYARLNSDGSTGAWSTTTNLPGARSFTGATSYNGYIYVVGGSNGSTTQGTVYYAKVNGDGTISANTWGTSGAMTHAEQNTQPSVVNGTLFVTGGDDSNAANANSYNQYAQINSNGSLGSWSNGTNMPANRGEVGVVTLNGYIYVISGWDSGSNVTTSVYYTQVLSDGSTNGSWQTSTNPLPIGSATAANAGREGARAVSVNGYIYLIGGDNNSAAQSTVFYTSTARTTLAGSLDLVGASNGQSIADGGSSGGSLTAGNTIIAGTLQVQDAATFNQGATIQNMLTVNGNSTGYIQTITNLSTASSALTPSSSADGLLINLGSSATTGNYYIGFATNGTVNGKIQGSGTAGVIAYTTSGADYAEYFRADPASLPQAGELVVLDQSQNQSVLRGAGDTQTPIAGIVSTSPGFIGNGPICNVDDNSCDSDYAKYNALVALSGQVPAKVNTSNGPIAIGDPIAVSAVAGEGAKAVGSGYIVGYAEEPLASGSGTIKVLVRPQYYTPSISQLLQGNGLTIAGNAEIDGNLTTGGNALIGGQLNVSGDVSLHNNLTVDGNVAFTGNLTVQGITTVSTLIVNNHIISQGSVPTIVVGTAAGIGDGLNTTTNPAVTVDGTDVSGTLNITTGKQNEATGVLAHINFSQAFNTNYHVVVSASNDPAGGLRIYTIKTATGFDLVTKDIPDASTQYAFDYIVMGTEQQQGTTASTNTGSNSSSVAMSGSQLTLTP